MEKLMSNQLLSSQTKKLLRSTRAFLFSGGGKRDRTADLLHAMQALYQLSYTPEIMVANQGFEPRTQGL